MLNNSKSENTIKKTKFFIIKKNPFDIVFSEFVDSITIEDFVIVNNEEQIYTPKEFLFLKTENALSSKLFSFYIDNNRLGENILGFYWGEGDSLTWNKDEGSFVNFDTAATYKMNSNCALLSLVKEDGSLFNLEELRLKIILIISH